MLPDIRLKDAWIEVDGQLITEQVFVTDLLTAEKIEIKQTIKDSLRVEEELIAGKDVCITVSKKDFDQLTALNEKPNTPNLGNIGIEFPIRNNDPFGNILTDRLGTSGIFKIQLLSQLKNLTAELVELRKRVKELESS